MDCRNELGFLELPGVRGAHSQVARIFARLHPIPRSLLLRITAVLINAYPR